MKSLHIKEKDHALNPLQYLLLYPNHISRTTTWTNNNTTHKPSERNSSLISHPFLLLASFCSFLRDLHFRFFNFLAYMIFGISNGLDWTALGNLDGNEAFFSGLDRSIGIGMG
jgi:hypothetical protein